MDNTLNNNIEDKNNKHPNTENFIKEGKNDLINDLIVKQSDKNSKERIKNTNDFVQDIPHQSFMLGATNLYFSWSLEWYLEKNPDTLNFLKKYLKNEILIDLWCWKPGYTDTSLNALQIPLKAYIGIDSNQFDEKDEEDIIYSKNNNFFQTEYKNEDLLRFVSKLPDNSVNFLLTGIDKDVLKNNEYRIRLKEQIMRTTKNQGLIINRYSADDLLPWKDNIDFNRKEYAHDLKIIIKKEWDSKIENQNISPNIFLNSLETDHDFVPCENKEILDLYNKLQNFISSNKITNSEAQKEYHSHIISGLRHFSGYINGYQKILNKFGLRDIHYYPNLNRHINFFCYPNELSPKAQKLVKDLISNMYEYIYVVKKLYKDQIIKEWGNSSYADVIKPEKLFNLDNYSLAENLLDLTIYKELREKGEQELSLFIDELVIMREKRLIIAQELEKEIFESESLFLKEKGVF